jgi:hypothetical protein
MGNKDVAAVVAREGVKLLATVDDAGDRDNVVAAAGDGDFLGKWRKGHGCPPVGKVRILFGFGKRRELSTGYPLLLITRQDLRGWERT